MLKLNINAKTPSAINNAIKKVKEMIAMGSVPRSAVIQLILEPGVYHENIRYNLSNPLVLESAPGVKASECIIQADNCEAYNRGMQYRAILSLGPNATDVTLRNFTVANLHGKTVAQTHSPKDAAETLVWYNTTGSLFCEGLHINGRQDTIYVTGNTWFLNSYISGTIDIISGAPDTSLFENCTIEIVEENRKEGVGDINAFAVNSHAIPEESGFIFSDCRFLAEKRKKGKVFACRTDGTSNNITSWDSIAFLNCTFSEAYDTELLWDNDMSLEVYPRGNAKTGIREYGSKVYHKDGTTENIDTTLRNTKVYTLTEDDFSNDYASRYLILGNTPFARGNPLQLEARA